MVLVKRIWSKKSQISEHTDILDIWDTGSHIFERWPNGDEIYWKIISREESENGFTEILEKMPIWQMPAEVLHKEQIPILHLSNSQFQIGSWSVEQVTETVVLADAQRKPNVYQKPYNKGKRYSTNKEKVI
jgi:hypothetical protein